MLVVWSRPTAARNFSNEKHCVMYQAQPHDICRRILTHSWEGRTRTTLQSLFVACHMTVFPRIKVLQRALHFLMNRAELQFLAGRRDECCPP